MSEKTINGNVDFSNYRDAKFYIDRSDINIARKDAKEDDSYNNSPIEGLKNHRKVLIKKLSEWQVVLKNNEVHIYMWNIYYAFRKGVIITNPEENYEKSFNEFSQIYLNERHIQYSRIKSVIEELNVTNQWINRKDYFLRKEA